MRRFTIFTISLISFSVSLLASDILRDHKDIKKRDTVSQESSYMINAGRMLKSTYSFFNENLDYLLTSKGVTKTVVVLAPFVILYGHYFGLDPIKDVGRSLLQTVGRMQAYYELQKVIGSNQQLMDEITSQPWSMFCVATVELIKSMGKKIKIPFIM